MNERIQQLSDQADAFARETVAYYRNEHDEYPNKLYEVSREKFAELIVKEAGALLMSPEFIGRSDLDWSMVLNEHFGVE